MLVMDVVVNEVLDKEVTKVVEPVNKELVKEFNEGLVKVYLSKANKFKLALVMDDVVDKDQGGGGCQQEVGQGCQ